MGWAGAIEGAKRPLRGAGSEVKRVRSRDEAEAEFPPLGRIPAGFRWAQMAGIFLLLLSGVAFSEPAAASRTSRADCGSGWRCHSGQSWNPSQIDDCNVAALSSRIGDRQIQAERTDSGMWRSATVRSAGALRS